MEDKRHKAFIGAVVGAALNIAGSAIAKKRQKREMKRQQQEQQRMQTEAEGWQQAGAMSQLYGNQDYLDEYEDKIILKNGGKVRKPSYDRLKVAKRYSCGGRKKALFGQLMQMADNDVSQTATAVGNFVSGLISSKPIHTKPVNKSQGFSYNTKDNKTVGQQNDSVSASTSSTGNQAVTNAGNMGDSIGNLIGSMIDKKMNSQTEYTPQPLEQPNIQPYSADYLHNELVFRLGGSSRKYPNIVSGGVAIPLPLKGNYYYMRGRKHASGGIDIGPNNRKGLEVEDGEVMDIKDNGVRVFSSVPFLQGGSPASLVLSGQNPDKVFEAQERFKDRNGISDDGRPKLKRRTRGG